MSVTPPPSINPPPEPAPQRNDRATFSDRVDAFVTWLYYAVPVFTSLTNWINDLASQMIGWLNSAAASAASAAASATQAQIASNAGVAAADLVATSTTPQVLTTGLVSLTIQTGKKFPPGMPIRAASNATPSARMDGYVKTYNAGTGALQMQSDSMSGAGGTYNDWNVFLTGQNSLASGTGGATTTSGLLTDVVLTAGSSNQYQQFSVRNQGAVRMPAYPAASPGQNLYTLANFAEGATGNDYNMDLSIKDASGNLLAFLGLNDVTACHMNAAQNWVFPEARPVGKQARFLGAAAARVGSTNGAFLQLVRLDADRVLILMHGISLQAVVYNQTTNNFGAITLIRASWATVGGSYDNAKALLTAADQTLVVSCPEGSTAAQAVVLTTSSLSITPGSATTVTLGAAQARLVDLIAVGSTYVLGYITAANAFRFRAMTISGTTPAAGAETTLTSPLPPTMISTGATTLAMVTGSGTTLSVTPYTVSAGTTLTVGSSISQTISDLTKVRLNASASGRWFLTCIVSNVARVFMLTFAAGAPAFSTSVVVSSTVTTVTQLQTFLYFFDMMVAVSGTNANGEFVTEFSAINEPGSGAPVLESGSLLARTSPTAQTVAAVGTNNTNTAGTITCMWVVASSAAIELLCFADQVSNVLLYRYNKIGPANVALPQPVGANYTKQNLHNGTLNKFGTTSIAALGDGTKPVLYSANMNDILPMRRSPQIVGNPANGARDDTTNSVWVVSAEGAEANVVLEQLRIAA